MGLDAFQQAGSMFAAPGAVGGVTGAGAGISAIMGGAGAAGGLSGLMAGGAGGPIAMVAGAALKMYQAKQAERAQKKLDQRQARQRMNEEAYSAALEDWRIRRDKQDWRNAAGNYKQFSSVGTFAPNYQNMYTPAAVGDQPTSEGYIAGNNSKTNAANSAYQKAQSAKTLSSYGGG